MLMTKIAMILSVSSVQRPESLISLVVVLKGLMNMKDKGKWTVWDTMRQEVMRRDTLATTC